VTGWRPTAALLRAATAGAAGALAAVLLGRQDLVVLSAPFLVLTALGLARAPTRSPEIRAHLQHPWLHEGQGTRYVVELGAGPDLEQATLVLSPAPFMACEPATGAVSGSSGNGVRLRLELGVSPRRWGIRDVGAVTVGATSAWGGFRWGPLRLDDPVVTAVPGTPSFASMETPHPVGLIGRNPSRRAGDGSDFWAIRRFHPGDRLRRVNWRTTLRTGELHVVGTTSEEDSSVLLLVDAVTDVGASDGVDGAESSLDLTVRAASALAAHHLRVGDRVSLSVLARTNLVLGPGTGLHHLRRIQTRLARITPGWPEFISGRHLRFRTAPGTIVLALSPMLTPEIITTMVRLSRRGLSLVAIDTLPADALPRPALDPRSPGRLGWRMRLVERRMLLDELTREGIPVVTWRGPGTLDEVLGRLARRARAPREVSR
jgi:uncharacterized protein (DUF58 family)